MRKPPPAPAIPEPGQAKRGEAGHLGYLLRQAGAALRARMEGALADLARLSLLTPPTVALIVANLRRAGSVASRPHPVHGRIRQLELTEAGAALLARCKPRVAAVESALVDGLPPAEEAAIRLWLVRVAAEGAT